MEVLSTYIYLIRGKHLPLINTVIRKRLQKAHNVLILKYEPFRLESRKERRADRRTRHSFERVVQHIESERVLDVIKHPNSSKYPNQRMFILEIDNYAYLVPFVENNSEIFLKTIIPSRKATRKYLEVKP